MSNEIQKVAIIGCGAIGASWAALFLAQGLTVTAYDINPAAQTTLHSLVAAALPTLRALGLLQNPSAAPSDIFFTTDLSAALDTTTDLVQENGPERLAAKHALLAQIAPLVRPDTLIASSTSGLTCSSIQAAPEFPHPERCLIAHPFNPPHLIPLVEIVGGSNTSPATIERALAFYRDRVGKKAIHVRKEVVGHVANRLQAALMREVVYLLQEGVVGSMDEIDAAVSYGPGLRWGVMGPGMLFHLGGGETGGVRHMTEHLLEPMMSWYAPQDPVIDDALKTKLVAATEKMVGDREFRDLARQRDEQLVQLLNIRKEWDGYAEAEAQKKE